MRQIIMPNDSTMLKNILLIFYKKRCSLKRHHFRTAAIIDLMLVSSETRDCPLMRFKDESVCSTY